jgi:hypothetical protein
VLSFPLTVHVQFIDYQDDFNRGIRLCARSIERLKGDNLAWLSVILKREIPSIEAGHWTPRSVPYLNIKPNHSLGWVRHRLVFKFS